MIVRLGIIALIAMIPEATLLAQHDDLAILHRAAEQLGGRPAIEQWLLYRELHFERTARGLDGQLRTFRNRVVRGGPDSVWTASLHPDGSRSSGGTDGVSFWRLDAGGTISDVREPARHHVSNAPERVTGYLQALRDAHPASSARLEEDLWILPVEVDGRSGWEYVLRPADSVLVERRLESASRTIRTRFDDFRLLDGVLVPHRMVTEMNGELFEEIVVTEVGLWAGHDKTIFGRPEE